MGKPVALGTAADSQRPEPVERPVELHPQPSAPDHPVDQPFVRQYQADLM